MFHWRLLGNGWLPLPFFNGRLRSFVGYVIDCFCLFRYACVFFSWWHPFDVVSHKLLSFAYTGAFAFVLLSVAVFCSRSVPWALALVCIVCCWAASSQLYLWGVSCDELACNKQMAHSQIVVLIEFSLTF